MSRDVGAGSAGPCSALCGAATATELFAAASRGEVLPLEDAAPAHRKLEACGVFGRIALTP